MNPLYNTALWLYSAGARVASLRSTKVREMLAGQAATLGILAGERRRVAPGGYDVWIHAASLGEFEQARPLIERLRRECPGITILLSFFSPSGYRVRHNYPEATTVVYLPFDTPARAEAFIEAAAPHLAIFVKYEFWANYLHGLRRRGIPTYIISAIFRPGQPFFRPWGGLWRGMLRCFSHIFVQDERSLQLLRQVGCGNVTVAGDTRFDRVTDIRAAAKSIPVIERFADGSQFTLVCGSSWGPDEDLYIPWLKENPSVRAVIAPHEFDAGRLQQLLRRLGPGAKLLSQLSGPDDLTGSETAIIVDCFGLLSSLYRYGSAAWIGGGFGAGIHNINEAAVYGIPVIFGPRHQKFKEASDLLAVSAATCVVDAASARTILNRLLADPEARTAAGAAAAQYINQSIGATDIIYSRLFS